MSDIEQSQRQKCIFTLAELASRAGAMSLSYPDNNDQTNKYIKSKLSELRQTISTLQFSIKDQIELIEKEGKK